MLFSMLWVVYIYRGVEPGSSYNCQPSLLVCHKLKINLIKKCLKYLQNVMINISNILTR